MAGWWSGGRLQGDLVAERLELADEVAGLAGGVDAAGVVVGAQVVEAGGGVGEQVPDDHQDGAGDGDQRLELADAFDEAAVALAEEGVGLGGGGGGLPECAFEVGLPLPVAPARRLAPDWIVRGDSLAHDTRCPGWGTGPCP